MKRLWILKITRIAQSAAGARIILDFWQMGVFVKLNCLIPSVVASHVAFATIDAHFRINQRNHMLPEK